jgi:hypothetical protein
MQVPKPVKTFELSGKEYTIVKLKAKHLVTIERGYKDIGDIEKGLRIAALLMQESMGLEALSYDELLEFDLEELTPLLDALSK